jgi:hypothetical protein
LVLTVLVSVAGLWGMAGAEVEESAVDDAG